MRKLLREIGVPTYVVKRRSSRPSSCALMCSAIVSSQTWRTPKVRGSLFFGWGFTMKRSPVGELIFDVSTTVSSTLTVRRRKLM